MINFNIQSKGEEATIEILGSIGESWFEDGATLANVKSQIEALSARNITIKISSLGGDAFEGLAIHDLLKASKKNVTAKIIGATASAGTIVALGANNIQISENALFLVHNSSTMVAGNAKDLRATAENLDTVDKRMVAIYTAKTGKSEDEVKALMAEDKWIDANEAQSFGFVDSITAPMKIAASSIEPIQNSKLPKLNDKQINNLIITKKELEMTEENKSWFAEQFAKLKPAPKAEAVVAETVVEPAEPNAVKELTGQVAEAKTVIEASVALNDELQAKLDAQNKEISDLNKAIAEAKIAKVEAKGSEANPEGIVVPNASEATFNSIKALVNKRRNR